MRKLNLKWIFCAGSFLLGASNAWAEGAATEATSMPDEQKLFYALVALAVSLLCIIIALAVIIIVIVDNYMNDTRKQSLLPTFPAEYLDRFWGRFTGNTPQSETETYFAGHSYDGIVELDNNPPPIFNYIFVGSIVFAIVYGVYYHAMDNPLMAEEYAQDMHVVFAKKELARANAKNSIDEKNVTALKDPASLSSGKNIFLETCASCHGKLGEGGIGPNLTDEYWLHGGGVQNIFHTVKEGVPAKGMIAWKDQLAPGQIAEVSSYILTLAGTNPPNGKEPQGEKYSEAAGTTSKEAAPQETATDSLGKGNKDAAAKSKTAPKKL